MGRPKKQADSQNLIQRGKKKIWQLRYMIDGKPKKESLHTSNYEEAIRKRDEILNPILNAKTKKTLIAIKMESNHWHDDTVYTPIDQSWVRIINSPAKPDIARHTLEVKESHWLEFIKFLDGLGGVKNLPDIRKQHIDNFFTIIKSKNSACNYNKKRMNIKHILKLLSGLDKFETTTFFDSIKETKYDIKSHKSLTIENIIMMFDHADNLGLEYGLFVRIGLYTGLRQKDICKLKWDKILDNCSTLCVNPFKTRKVGVGDIYIPIHRELLQYIKSAYEIKGSNIYVMPSLSADFDRGCIKLKKFLIAMYKSIGLTPTVEPDETSKSKRKINQYGAHSLRHSFVTLCRKVGVEEELRKYIVGHKDGQTSKYGEFNIDKMREQLDKICITSMGESELDICKKELIMANERNAEYDICKNELIVANERNAELNGRIEKVLKLLKRSEFGELQKNICVGTLLGESITDIIEKNEHLMGYKA